MKKKILFVLSLLFGLIFINAGLNKFFYYMPVPDDLPAEVVRVSTAFMEISLRPGLWAPSLFYP
jgi:uncharacterized membrane protein YphA (DoxX/SURF4 family)